jgi:NAD(P)-dependent dehydrogenase (short-subunit alcohol dehydrogenase family)
MPSVLVTGAARGIGRSIVTHLAANGWDVIAGVRSKDDAADIAAADPQRISPVILDVTNAEQIAALNDSLPERLDAVVNNAGIVVGGPIETVSPDELRRQFEVNVIGQVAVTQAVLPPLRKSQGRIVFISSVNGKVAFPLIGAYCASKFALEAAADALRMELKPWNIAVVVVEPAQTDTDIWRTAHNLLEETAGAMTPEQLGLYADHLTGLKKSIPMSQRLAGPPEKVAATVEEALTARRPRARYVVGIAPKLQVALITNLPAAARDSVLRRLSSQPGRA